MEWPLLMARYMPLVSQHCIELNCTINDIAICLLVKGLVECIIKLNDFLTMVDGG